MRLNIEYRTHPAELYHQRPGAFAPQGANIELDIARGELSASWDEDTGNAVPISVHYGRVRRYGIPLLTADAVNRVMDEIADWAEAVVLDSRVQYENGNRKVTLDAEGMAAEAAIHEHLDREWGDADCVLVCDLETSTNGEEVSDCGITASTTDAELDRLAEERRAELAAITPSGVVVLDGFREHLSLLRDELRDAEE